MTTLRECMGCKHKIFLVSPFMEPIQIRRCKSNAVLFTHERVFKRFQVYPGFFIGILPDAGSTLSSFLSYAMEKFLSKHPELFGEGVTGG